MGLRDTGPSRSVPLSFNSELPLCRSPLKSHADMAAHRELSGRYTDSEERKARQLHLAPTEVQTGSEVPLGL